MKEKNKQKPKIPDGFWNIPRPEISFEEVLSNVSKINWEETSKNRKKKKEPIIIHSPHEIKSNL